MQTVVIMFVLLSVGDLIVLTKPNASIMVNDIHEIRNEVGEVQLRKFD